MSKSNKTAMVVTILGWCAAIIGSIFYSKKVIKQQYAKGFEDGCKYEREDIKQQIRQQLLTPDGGLKKETSDELTKSLEKIFNV